jgi:hypothetical protein
LPSKRRRITRGQVEQELPGYLVKWLQTGRWTSLDPPPIRVFASMRENSTVMRELWRSVRDQVIADWRRNNSGPCWAEQHLED